MVRKKKHEESSSKKSSTSGKTGKYATEKTKNETTTKTRKDDLRRSETDSRKGGTATEQRQKPTTEVKKHASVVQSDKQQLTGKPKTTQPLNKGVQQTDIPKMNSKDKKKKNTSEKNIADEVPGVQLVSFGDFPELGDMESSNSTTDMQNSSTKQDKETKRASQMTDEISSKSINAPSNVDKSDQELVDSTIKTDPDVADLIKRKEKLADFKVKVVNIIQASGGKIIVNQLCNRFKDTYGQNIRKFCNPLKVGRVVDFIKEQCSDVFGFEGRENSSNQFLYEIKNCPADIMAKSKHRRKSSNIVEKEACISRNTNMELANEVLSEGNKVQTQAWATKDVVNKRLVYEESVEDISESTVNKDPDIADSNKKREILADFKEKVCDIIQANGGKILVNQVGDLFKDAYGQRIRKFCHPFKVRPIVDFIKEQCADVFGLDDPENTSNQFLYEINNCPTDIIAKPEQQRKGSSIVQGNCITSESLKELKELMQVEILSDVNKVQTQAWLTKDVGNERKKCEGFNLESTVEGFSQYRDFQMIHVAYCKFRIVMLYATCGKRQLELDDFCMLFKEMYCENFFSKSVLKFYTSENSQEGMVIDFIHIFCKEFLEIKKDMKVNINGDLARMHAKFMSNLITVIEGIEIPGFDFAQFAPTPAELSILGNKVIENQLQINVFKVENRGGHYSTLTEFPNVDNRTLHGRERPSMDELDDHIYRIRKKICREGKAVMLTTVVAELCSFYKVSNIRELHPLNYRELRKDTDIPALNDIQRLQGKVNAFIQAFVQFRNICTLHELDQEISKMEGKATFDQLKLGPLQKQPLVYHFFQFPPTKESIPTITTLDVFRLLNKLLKRQHRANQLHDRDSASKLSMEEVLEELTEKYGFKNPYESGVLIGSIALAIQCVRKAFFGDMNSIKESKQRFYDELTDNFDQLLAHTSKEIIRPGKPAPGEPETLIHKISGMNIIDGFCEIFNLLDNLKREAKKTLPETAGLIKFSESTRDALLNIKKDKLLSRFFHVLLSTAPLVTLGMDDVGILMYLGFKPVIEEMLLAEGQQKSAVPLKTNHPVTPKGKLMETVKKWLSKAVNLDLKMLDNIESQVTLEIDNSYTSFNDLGHGSFLNFITSNPVLFEMLELSTNDGKNGNTEVSRHDIIEFVKQCDRSVCKDDVVTALTIQYGIAFKENSFLLKIVDSALADCKPKQTAHVTSLQSLLCGSDYHQNVKERLQQDNNTLINKATRRILSAPYLTDLNEWLNWDVMYQPQLGHLRDFIHSVASQNKEVVFVEICKNKFVTVVKNATSDMFNSAVKSLDARLVSSTFVAILNASGHLSNTPIALLTNHIQSVFLEPSQDTDDLLRFCLECFTLLPFEVLSCVVEKMFLNPLSKVLGKLNVSMSLLNICNDRQRSVLHALGIHLSIQEWLDDYEKHLDNGYEVNDDVTSGISEISSHHDQMSDSNLEDVENTGFKEERTGDNDQEDKQESASEDEQTAHTQQLNEMICAKLKQTDENVSTRITDQEASICVPDLLVDDSNNTINDTTTIVAKDGNSTDDVKNTVQPMFSSVDTKDEIPELLLDPCQQFIENIRREQFGIGETFGEKESKLIEIHREREGRSLDRLSKELYTKDSHFVLELIQNADDNEYPEEFMLPQAVERPTVAFIVEKHQVTILNNEIGFLEKNIRALCDVGKSTKGKHRKGYIGQKGIGFKSVFRVTDRPEIHSNGYHIKFDASSGANGYILPVWLEGDEETNLSYNPTQNEQQEFTWKTKIVLPLKSEMQHSKLTSRFHDIHPSLLMFLNRLHKIIIDDKVSGTFKVMCKEKLDENLIRLSDNESSSLWFTVSQEIPIELCNETRTTDISVAFPIQHVQSEKDVHQTLPAQPVFAFLPLRSYGFKFIIQADFEVPSSREDIDKDSSWNQCILQHLPDLVVSAFQHFKTHSHFSNLDGLVEYFKFMDLEDHVLGIFKFVANQIIQKLQREPCLPVQLVTQDDSKDEKYNWIMPQSIVMSKESQQNVIPADMLHKNLGLYYIHKDIEKFISRSVYKSLGVEKMNLEQLIEVAKTVVLQQQYTGEELHTWIGCWLDVICNTMQELCDYSRKTIDMICSLKIFPLCDGTFVALKDNVVFFPMESNGPMKNKKDDVVRVIENDLSILSHALLSNLEAVKRQRVHRLLQDFGVKTMRPYDLVHDYILPLFKRGKWKEKSNDVIISCVMYLHYQLRIDEHLCNIDDFKNDVVLMTNKGLHQPAKHQIYLSKEFGNDIDLQRILPACDWTIITTNYLTSVHSSDDLVAWRDFLLKLGLKMFAGIRKTTLTLHKSDLDGTHWSSFSKTWPATDDDNYVIEDLSLPEFTSLIQSKDTKQFNVFAEMLDNTWDKEFEKFTLNECKCPVKTTAGDVIGMTYSSAILQIRNTAWIKGSRSENYFFVPRDLFRMNKELFQLLDKKVNYLSSTFRSNDFIAALGVQTEITFEQFVEEFKKWRDEELFSTTYLHIMNIYDYFIKNILSHPKLVKELLEKPFFFLLSGHCKQQLVDSSIVEGKFYLKKDVCWDDPSGLITNSNMMVSTRRILRGFYPDNFKDYFVRTLGVSGSPSAAEYLTFLSKIVIKSGTPDKEACQQIYRIFALLSNHCIHNEQMMETLQDWQIPDDVLDRARLYRELQDYLKDDISETLNLNEVMFPTSSNTYTSLEKQPILVIDKSVAEIYEKEGNIPLIFLEDIISGLQPKVKGDKKHVRSRRTDVQKQLIQILLFLKACRLPLLQDIIEQSEVVPEMPKTGFEKWQTILHQMAPFIQRYLMMKQPDIYNDLQESGFASYLKGSTFFEVTSLEVIYRLKDRVTVNIKVPKRCHVDKSVVENKAFIYVVTESKEDKGKEDDVILDLVELFVGTSNLLKEELSDFIMSLMSSKRKEDVLRRKKIPVIPSNVVEWFYPKPYIAPPPPPPPKVTPLAVEPIPKESDQRLSCWPPRNPANIPATSTDCVKTKSVTVNEEEKKILERWQPPSAPDADSEMKAELDKGIDNITVVSNTGKNMFHNKPPPTNASKDDFINKPQDTSATNRDFDINQGSFPPLGGVVEAKQGMYEKDATEVKDIKSDKGTCDSYKTIPDRKNSSNGPTSSETKDTSYQPKLTKTFGNQPEEANYNISSSTNHVKSTEKRSTSHSESNHQFDPSLIQNTELIEQYEDLELQFVRNTDGEFSFSEKFLEQVDTSNGSIGLLGERIVYEHLCNVYKNDIENGSVTLKWLNEENETGNPYDIEIIYAEHMKAKNVFIEVKSTSSNEKKEFQISSQQLQFAFEQGPCFHLYRVSGLHSERTTQLKRLVNLAMYMDNKSVKLFMIL